MDRREMLGLFGALGTTFPLLAADHEAKKEPHATGSPLTGPHAHFCGIHMAKKDPKFQLVTQHYCTAHAETGHDDLFQCVLFDKSGANAKLLGVEAGLFPGVDAVAVGFFRSQPRSAVSMSWRP